MKRFLLSLCVAALAVPSFSASAAAGEEAADEQPLSTAIVETAEPGVLLAQDSFASLPGALHGSGGGLGWKQPWITQNNDTTVPGFAIADTNPLTYPGVFTGGNYAAIGRAYLKAYRPLDNSASGPFAPYLTEINYVGKHGTTLWFSALIRKEVNNNEPISFGNDWSTRRLHFGYTGTGSNDANGLRYWSMNLDGQDYRSNVQVTPGQTALLVGKVEYGPETTVSLYVNPDLSGGVPESPSVTGVTYSNLAFRYMVLGTSNSTGQGAIDELKIGTGFHAVTSHSYDSILPSPPTRIEAVKVRQQSVSLVWSGAADNVGVTGYNVYVDGALATTTQEAGAVITGLQHSTTYAFTVRSFDAQGNESAESSSFIVTTGSPPDPGVILAQDSFAGEPGVLHGASGGLGWKQPWITQNNDATVPGYAIAGTNPLSYPGVLTGGNYAVGGRVYLTAYRPVDIAASGPFAPYLTENNYVGKHGTTLWFSALIRKEVNNNEPVFFGNDWTSRRLQLGYTGAGSNDANGLRYWSMNLDGQIYRSDVQMTAGQTALLVGKVEYGPETTVSLYVNPDLSGGLPESPSVTASTYSSLSFRNMVFLGGNNTGQGAMDELKIGTGFHSVTSGGYDAVPPSPPTRIEAVKVRQESAILVWSGATDNVGVTGYKVFVDGTLAATIEEAKAELAGLEPLTAYTITIRAHDAQGNESQESAPFPLTTAGPPEPLEPGAILAMEPFDADLGTLHGAAGGLGWSAPWIVQNNSTTIPGFSIDNVSPLTYPGIETDGNYASGGTGYLAAYRQLDRASDLIAPYLNTAKSIGKHGATLWFSALMRKEKANNTSIYFGSEWSSRRLRFGYPGTAANVDGVRYWTLTLDGQNYLSDVPIVAGETALLVGKVEFGPTSTVSMYVNPDLSQGLPEEPNVVAATTSDLSFKSVVFYGGNPHSESSLDEIRIGTTFHSVTQGEMDYIPPSPPAQIEVLEQTGESIVLEWSGAADNVGVQGYRVYYLGELMAVTEDTSVRVAKLLPVTTYNFTIRAYDYQGNESLDSSFVTASTVEPADFNRYNFENGQLHGFKAISGDVQLELDTGFSYKGDASMKVTASAGTMGVAIDNPDPMFRNGQTVSFRVYVPTDTQLEAIQPFIFGTGWSWNGQYVEIGNLIPGEWNTIAISFANGDSPSPRLGMNIFASGQSEFWVDSITYSGYSDPDTVPPTIPGNLRLTSNTDHMAALSWNPSTDDVGVTAYEIYKNGELYTIISSSQTSGRIMELAPSTAYTFTVKARDGAGNVSESSNPVFLVTDSPHARLVGEAFGSYTQGYLGIDLGENEFKRLTKLRFYVNNPATAAGGKFQASLQQDEGYSTIYSVRSGITQGWNEIRIDDVRGFRYFRYLAAAPNAGAFVSEIEYYGADGDIEPPSAPAALQVAGVSETAVSLSWTAAADNFGIKRYLIYVNNMQAGESTEPAFTVTGLNPNETYAFTVQAVDLAELVSVHSQPATAVTNKAALTLSAVYHEEQGRIVVEGAVSSGDGRQVSLVITDANEVIQYAGQIRSGYNGSFLLSVPIQLTAAGPLQTAVSSLGADGAQVLIALPSGQD
jgi:chitodextrinase